MLHRNEIAFLLVVLVLAVCWAAWRRERTANAHRLGTQWVSVEGTNTLESNIYSDRRDECLREHVAVVLATQREFLKPSSR